MINFKKEKGDGLHFEEFCRSMPQFVFSQIVIYQSAGELTILKK